jgi:hypothetical protein
MHSGKKKREKKSHEKKIKNFKNEIREFIALDKKIIYNDSPRS